MVDSEICLIRNLNVMVSQRYSEAPLKCCRKSVKADVMCFIKAQRNILKVPLLFSSVWQTDCVELAYCFTPLQSDVFKKRPGMCEVWKLLFAKLDQLSMDLRKNMQLNTDLHTDSVGHMTVPWAFQSSHSWESRSAADMVIIACIHVHRNSATWSMAKFHHHLKLCRQVEESRSSAHMWWMIKLDKWFALLNCPIQCDAH